MLTLGMAWLLSHIIHTLSCSQKVQSFEIAEALKQPPGVEPGVEYQTWLAGVSPWTKWWYILWMVYFIQPLNLCVLFVEGTYWKWESPYILKFHQLLIDGSENHSSTASCKPSHVLTNRMHISLKIAWLNQIILAKNWVPQQPYGLSSFPRCITISTDWGQDSPVRLANICQYRNSMKPVEIKHIVLPILLDFKLTPHIVLFWRISPLIMFNPLHVSPSRTMFGLCLLLVPYLWNPNCWFNLSKVIISSGSTKFLCWLSETISFFVAGQTSLNSPLCLRNQFFKRVFRLWEEQWLD